jgi:hypothetical protein
LDVWNGVRQGERMTATQLRPINVLSPLATGVRTAVSLGSDWAGAAQLVAEEPRRHLPALDVLTAAQRVGSPDDSCATTLYRTAGRDDLDRRCGVAARQVSRIHDRTTWGVLGVIQGAERNELFDADLNLVGQDEHHVGDASGFAPPGDIHRVRNATTTTASPIHINGTDITRIACARRYYDDQPIDTAWPATLFTQTEWSIHHVTRPSPVLLRLTRRLRHRQRSDP